MHARRASAGTALRNKQQLKMRPMLAQNYRLTARTHRCVPLSCCSSWERCFLLLVTCCTMAAIALPASGSTVVTIPDGAAVTSTLDIFLPADDPFVLAYPCLRWDQHAAVGDVVARASLPQYVFIRVFLLRHDIGPASADLFVARNVGPLEASFGAAAWSRWLTELAASGLLAAGPFHKIRDSDAAMTALSITNPDQLTILASDYGLSETFDTPAIAPAADSGQDQGRGARVSTMAGAPTTPGPVNLKFLDLVSLERLYSPGDVSPLAAYCRLAGALGPCYTRAVRADVRSSVHLTAMILHTQVSKIAGHSVPLALSPANNALLAHELAPAIRAAYGALTDAFALDELTADGFQREMQDVFIYYQGTAVERTAVLTRRLRFIDDRCSPPLLAHITAHTAPRARCDAARLALHIPCIGFAHCIYGIPSACPSGALPLGWPHDGCTLWTLSLARAWGYPKARLNLGWPH